MLPHRWALCSVLTALFFAFAAQWARAQAPLTGPHFVGPLALDSTYAPGDNFYQYANGRWGKRTVIPPEGYCSALTELITQNDALLNDLVSDVIAGSFQNQKRHYKHILLNDLVSDVIAGQYNRTQAGRLLYAFYRSGVDSLLSPQKSKRSLQQHLKRIQRLRTQTDLQHYLADQLELPTNRLMGLYAVDDIDTTRMVQAVLGRAGLTIPLKYYQPSLMAQPAVQQEYLHFLATWTCNGTLEIFC